MHVHAGVFRGQKMVPDALNWITGCSELPSIGAGN